MKRTTATKASLAHSCRSRIFEALRKAEDADWLGLVKPLGLPAEASNALVTSLSHVVRLPFADAARLADLLIFRYAELPTLQRGPRRNPEAERVKRLFELMLDMALQGNSLFPQNPTDIASQAREALENPSPSFERFAALDSILLSSNAETRTGLNFARAKDPDEVIEYEHRRRSGNPEWCWKTPEKYALLETELEKQPEFSADWHTIRSNFGVNRFRDAEGVIRRSPLVEGNWRKPSLSDLQDEASRFQVVFDFFCWKWFLYGMRGNAPMLQKLAVTLTPFGTQIFIPGFWSLDPARDINWAKVTRLHRARGISKQGEKLAQGREAHRSLVLLIAKSDREARENGLKGTARYDFVKRKARLSPETDDAEIRQYLRKGRTLK